MYIPQAVPLAKHKKDKTISSWIVQIEPQFDAHWNSVSDDTELIALYAEKAKAAGYENNIKKLLDSDAKLYGADCGYSDPNADPKQPPSDGPATFSRGVAHHGPCEIWLDDTMVLHDNDCAKTFGTSDYETMKSVFKLIDYSSYSLSGCMLCFYWLAFQGSTTGKSKYIWQIYKNCVPLTGSTAGQTSTASTASNTTQTAGGGGSSTGSSSTETPTTSPASGDQTAQALTSKDATTPQTTAMASKAPAPVTPSTTDKCKDPKRKRV